MDDMGRDITVVGGGIGGMTASILLARSGAAVTMLERASGSTAVGAGILLQPNGLAVLDGLGLRDEVEARGTTLGGSVVRNERGARISDLQTPDFGRGLGHLVAVRRSDLHDVLNTAVAAEPGIEGRYDCEVTGVDSSGTVDRLVLLGDAAHAMEPTLGQGANTALVDAAILADQLATSSSPGRRHDPPPRVTAAPSIHLVKHPSDLPGSGE